MNSRLVLLILLGLVVSSGCSTFKLTPQEQALENEGIRRHLYADALIVAGKYEPATEVLVSLWKESSRPGAPRGTYGDRNLRESISKLVREYEPAKAAFDAMREPAETRVLSSQAMLTEERSWIDFTQMIGAEDALVAYAERFHRDRGRMRRLAYEPIRAFDRLIAQDRWDLAGWVYVDPVREAGGDFGFKPSGGEPGPVLRTLVDVIEFPLVAMAPVTRRPRGYDITARDTPERRELFKQHEEKMLNRAARIAVACAAAGRRNESTTIRRTIKHAVGPERAAQALERAESERRRGYHRDDRRELPVVAFRFLTVAVPKEVRTEAMPASPASA